MIERLINLERICEGPEYRKFSIQIIQLKRELYSQLDQRGKEQLEELTNVYLAQSSAILERSFTAGFCAAVELAADCLEGQNTNGSTANPQQPPES